MNTPEKKKPRGRPFKKGNPGKQPGTKHKFTQIKEDMLKAYEMNGGVEWLAKWAKDNPGKFMTIAASLIPKDVNVKQSGEVTITHQSAEVSRVNNWIGQITEEGIRRDNEDTPPERPLLPH